MRKLLVLGMSLLLMSCVNQIDRINDAQKKYPKCVVQPCTSMLSERGYSVMIEDTISNQIYVISYYPFSSCKIWDIRNIK